MLLDEFIARLEEQGRVKKSGGGYMAQCPSHEDGTESLSVKDGDDKILLKCQAGCATPAVVEALGLEMRDLFYDAKASLADDMIEATYEYTDAEGRPVFEVVRFQGKRFMQRLAGSSEWGLKGLANKPLFRLPNVRRAAAEKRRVYVVEGEKDVLALEAAGKIATCSAGGAGKWNHNYVHFLRDIPEVVVVADKDEPGLMHADQVAETLRAAQIPHRVVQAKEGKDAYDHLAAGLTTADFVELPKSYGGISVMTASMITPTETRWIKGWEGFFPYGGIAHVAGMPGVNKSTLTARLAAEISRTGKGALMIGGEDAKESVIVPRLIAANADMDRIHFPREHLSIPHDQEALEAHVDELNVSVVIVDPVEAHLDRGIDAYRNQDIRRALAPLALLADSRNLAVILVGHPNKNKERDPMMRVGGSIGIPGIARAAMIMGLPPGVPEQAGIRVLARYKGNWSEAPQARQFSVRASANGSIYLESSGISYLHASELLKRNTGQEDRDDE